MQVKKQLAFALAVISLAAIACSSPTASKDDAYRAGYEAAKKDMPAGSGTSTALPAATPERTPSSISTARPTTALPTPTAMATPRTLGLGEPVRYDDGWSVSALKVENYPSMWASSTQPLEAGMRWVIVTIRIENGTGKDVSVSRLDFTVQDSAGVRRERATSLRSDELKTERLGPGITSVGTLVFQAPIGDQKLALVYSSSNYSGRVLRLY